MRPVCPSSQRVRSIDITGVIPLPPEISSSRSGRYAGRRKSPSAAESPRTIPTRARSARKRETSPSEWVLTVSSRDEVSWAELAGE